MFRPRIIPCLLLKNLGLVKTIKFKKGINLLFGENGSVKTTILEGVYLISLGRSFKTINSKNYIKKDTQ